MTQANQKFPRKLSDDSLSPNPDTVFPVHRDKKKKLQETAEATPFPVQLQSISAADLSSINRTLNAIYEQNEEIKMYLESIAE